MIVKIENSTKDNKRFKVTMDNGREIHFGYKGAYTWLDGASSKIRDAYKARHYANETEKKLIDNLIVSPSTMSFYLIWGRYRDVNKNIKYLNNLWKKKHSL